ncbi:MAG: enoyl-CoA hydratase/isomerase family protein, partial [Rhizobiaceae bacterium]|nr:enoyl-CoA hydratase/isomerase family protein [Rhizobiaceae bacterium]
MSENPDVIVLKEGRVARLRLNRPDRRNAIAWTMVSNLIEIVQDFERDKSIEAVVLEGTGEHFCAGGDIRKYIELVETPEAFI